MLRRVLNIWLSLVKSSLVEPKGTLGQLQGLFRKAESLQKHHLQKILSLLHVFVLDSLCTISH